MSELKPCPKCGDVWVYASTGDYGSEYEALGYRIKCRCGYAWEIIPWKQKKECAIEAWNRRVDDEHSD